MKRMAAMLPTNANNSGQRVVRISVLRMSVTVSKPTSGRNTPSATNAVSTVPRSASPKRVPKAPDTCAAPISDLFDIRPPQQALGQKDQSDRQHRKRGDIFVVDREVSRPQCFDEADQKTADDRTRQRANAAE